MVKNKAFWGLTAAIFLIFNSNNISFALSDADSQNVCPDYAYEFTGTDTCEKFNRKLFVFNLKLNKCILRPVNIVWASIMPKYGMDRLQNAYNNMNYPVRVVSCLLQKDFKASKQETVRFLANTTLGLGGLYDIAQTRFKIEPRQEDIEQVLAHYKVKKGPYLVLPVVRGNVRDLVGQLLDCPLRPTSYAGPFGAAANAMFAVNNTTYMQPIFKKVDENYPDPYLITKQIDGINRYIKELNLDRTDVFEEKTASQNLVKIKNVTLTPSLKPDIVLNNFNPQGSLTDSTRTALFDNQKIDESIWSDMSVWNRSFIKKLKIGSVSINPNRKKYEYKYILQKNKTAPLAILYPSIGEGISADKSVVLAKILYDEGYSVMILGSSFHWAFINSMPQGYKPGLPFEDAQLLRLATGKIIDNIKNKKECKGTCEFEDKILVGCSFGALTGLFAAAQEEQAAMLGEKTLGIRNYISINPPIEMLFALKNLDKYSQDWKNDSTDIKLKTAITAQKVMRVSKNICHKDVEEMPKTMPFTEDETKLLIGFIMKQKLYDVVFAVENASRCQNNELCEVTNKMSFSDYAEKYLFAEKNSSYSQINYETSMHSLSDFLMMSKNYKIYHTLDDYFVNQEQLVWLKNTAKSNSVLFSNGSHLGCMYRKEFLDEFRKDIKLQKTEPENGL